MLCRVEAGSLWYMTQQVLMLGRGLLATCTDRSGQAWRRYTNFGDEPRALKKTWRIFACLAVAQVFSAFDDFLSSTRAELNRWQDFQTGGPGAQSNPKPQIPQTTR